jgi:hypothetical protein
LGGRDRRGVAGPCEASVGGGGPSRWRRDEPVGDALAVRR